MRILLATSALVLVAILWCVISIMQHVRLARRRARLLRESRELGSHAASLPAPASMEQVAPLPARFAASGPSDAITPQRQPPQQPLDTSQVPAQHTPATPARFTTLPATAPAIANRDPARLPQPSPAPLRILEFVPNASQLAGNAPVRLPADIFPATPAFPDLRAPAEKLATRVMPIVAAPSATLPAEQADPRLRRPVRSAPPPPSSSAAARPANRTDWIYFNKDMGDLSDPTPSRVRDRVRAR